MNLTDKKCVPCEGGVPAFGKDKIEQYLKEVPGWQATEIEDNGKKVDSLQKRYQFANFREAMKFLREVEDIAEGEGHHPDFCVHYNKVDFTVWTHAIGGLSENDFILAAKIDSIGK